MPRRAMGPAVVLVATMWVCPAQAQPRVVAVIDAGAGTTNDPDIAALAARLEVQLEHHETDLVMAPAERRPALLGAIPDETVGATTAAAASLERGRDALSRFDESTAIDAAAQGLVRAAALPPTPVVDELIADLAFVRGMAELDGASDAAVRDFALVRRLDPARALDPAKYLPEVLDAYAKGSQPGAPLTLEVGAPAGGTIWIDGVSEGPAPQSVSVAPGLHVIVVTGATLITSGQIYDTANGAKLALDADEASSTTIVHRLRRALVDAASGPAQIDAVAALVRAAGGQDAILIGRDDQGALMTRTYAGKTGTLGEPKPASGRDAGDILAPLRPIKVKLRPVIPYKVIPIEKPWYRRRWVQVSIGSGVVAAVLVTVAAVVTQPQGMSVWTGLGFPKTP